MGRGGGGNEMCLSGSRDVFGETGIFAHEAILCVPSVCMLESI